VKSNATKLAVFTDRARFYQRLARQISTDLRDLEALRTAREFMIAHTGGDTEDLRNAIESLEESIVLDLQVNGFII
jgi:hypothetical protein